MFSCFHERVLVVVISRCSVCLEVFISANLWVCFLRTSAPRGEDWNLSQGWWKAAFLILFYLSRFGVFCIGALLQQLGMFISVIYPNRQPMLINRQDYFKLERISVCDPLQILTFIFQGFILHAQKAANNRTWGFTWSYHITLHTCSASASGENLYIFFFFTSRVSVEREKHVL